MSDTPSDSSTPLAEIAHGPSKFEEFLENNQKLLLVVAVLIALGTAGFVVMQGIEKGKQEAASAGMIDAMNADELKKVIDEHAGTQASKSAQLLLADNQWSMGEKDASIATLQGFLADEASHPAAPTAKASLASKLMVQGRSDEAKPLLQDLVDDAGSRYLGAFALISLGDIAAAAGDTDQAKSSYERVISDYSDSDFTGTANSRIRDLGAVAPTEVAAPEPLEIKPETSKNDPETEAVEAALDKEITLDPTKLPAPANPLVPAEDKSPETESPESE